MWVVSVRGFFSAVQKPADVAEGMLTVRARAEGDLLSLRDLLPDAKPFQDPKATDYPWRVRVSKTDWQRAVSVMAGEIDYSNFKNAVDDRQGEARADVYANCWVALLAIEHEH